MSTNTKKFLAVYTGTPNSARMAEWKAMSEEKRKAAERAGMEAWHAWMKQHAAAVVETGGPLGKTKSVSGQGIADIRNNLSGFTIVSAASHEEAASLFVNHPHFANFPGEAIEIMEIMPVPGTPG